MSNKNKRERDDEGEEEARGAVSSAGGELDELVFEDQFEDDYDSEDVEVEARGEGGEGKDMNESGEDEDEETEKKVWNPAEEPLKPGEKLEYDNSAYDIIHFIGVEWPCLSFDILPDILGVQRTQFPHTLYMVAGTQGSKDADNSILIMKLSELHSTKHDDDSAEGFDIDQPDDLDDDPIMENRTIPHPIGSINRIRAMPQQPHVVAVLSSNREVNLYDLKQHISALDRPPVSKLKQPTPFHTFKGHPVEGWALDWSPKAPGRLVSGDCGAFIYLWEPIVADWNVDKIPFTGHSASVEDLSWSPTEGDVFSSCSVDGTIKLWDTRKGKKDVASINAHSTDVNVLSWNSKRAFLLASGADDGCFRIWDLRKLGAETKHQFAFNWHNGAITSIEWNPNDDSELTVSSSDNSISIWDLSLATEKTKVDGIEIPSQLLFVHQGQEHIKEVHWHKQIPGLLISTAADGFNVFKPSNISA